MPELGLKKDNQKIHVLWDVIAKDILTPFIPKTTVLKK